MSETTYWNGEETPANRVRVRVERCTKPRGWYRDLIGQERDAVEVRYSAIPVYLDDENGRGWSKVTEGRGSPRRSHWEFDPEEITILTCVLCYELPAAVEDDDPFCAACRLEVDAMSYTISDPVETVLARHRHVCSLSDLDATMCCCGEKIEGGPGFHRRHVAEHVRAVLGLDPPEPWKPAVAP